MLASYQKILLNAVAVTGAGDVSNSVNGMSVHTVTVEFTNVGGAVTELVVALEGTIDGVKFFPLKTYTLSSSERSAKFAKFHAADMAVASVRANLVTLTDTGTSAVTVKHFAR